MWENYDAYHTFFNNTEGLNAMKLRYGVFQDE